MEQATINDFRLFGARFGIEIAQAAKQKRAEGMTLSSIRAHVLNGMIPVKDAQLRSIGASDQEIGTFMRSAGNAAYADLGVDDLLGVLSVTAISASAADGFANTPEKYLHSELYESRS